ncbi:MAG: hypothetical protein FD165_211 [Gammaproteobacteria bacterium]|nr:MAG: hypothetical protein FD165_211 [Gammaproteobacteria bacterium]TND06789.1 MAG: hypothetical protein FD120_521 [Gammaproteobacteria bacterium]
MSSPENPVDSKKKRSKTHHVTLWHRYLGLTGLAFILVLAVTGIMLNHTELLKLDSRFVESGLLLDWYDIKAPDNTVSYHADNLWVTQLGDQLYLNDHRIHDLTGVLVGALVMEGVLVVGLEGSVVLMTPEGGIIERLTGTAGVPAGMTRIGVDNSGNLIVQAAHGQYSTDATFLEWREYTDRVSTFPLQVVAIAWAEPQAPPPPLQASIVRAYRTTVLPLERIALDIHGGPFVGKWGKYFVDAVGVLFVVLALFGFWIWAARKWRRG